MKSLRNSQDGLASIVIVISLLVVISLITIGFSTMARREQRQALDHQLTAQARYAAESAINNEVALYRDDPVAYTPKTDCTPVPTFPNTDTDEIQTTCVISNVASGELQYDQVPASDSTLIWLDPSGTSVDRLVITWERSGDDPGECMTTGYNQLPPSINNDQIGMLRFDLWSADTGAFSRDSLQEKQYGGVLYPRSGGSVVSEGSFVSDSNPTNQPVIFGACDGTPPEGVGDPYRAHATIDLPGDSSRYLLRLIGVYKGSKVKVVGFETGDINRTVNWADAQLEIEATARVNDIVQRIQVRVPGLSPPRGIVPDYGIHVTNSGICKLLEVRPGSSPSDGCS